MSFIKQVIKKWACKECDITDINHFYGQQEFDELKKTILAWTERRTLDDQIILLDYVVDMLKEDICSGNAAKVLMKPFSSPFFNFIPTSYEDENGKQCSILWLMSLWNFSRFIPMKVALLMIIGTKLSANG